MCNHNWIFYGGRNAGCGINCMCSIPVYQCSKCEDFDYGDNHEARVVMYKCKKKRAKEDWEDTKKELERMLKL